MRRHRVVKQPRYDLPHAAPGRLRLVQQFVNTCDHEHGREWLLTPDDLESWLRDQGLDAGTLRDADLQRARAVRDALRALLIAHNRGAFDPAALRVVNAAMRRAQLTPQFDERGDPQLVPLARGISGALGSILAPAYAAALDGTWPRLKACRNCRWAFYDYSKNRSAVWCSMALCGNRLKTRSYRRRRSSRRTSG